MMRAFGLAQDCGRGGIGLEAHLQADLEAFDLGPLTRLVLSDGNVGLSRLTRISRVVMSSGSLVSSNSLKV
jgi:hypothetical protein